MSEAPFIAIVDDDIAMREALFDLLQVTGFLGRTYAGAAAFLDDYKPGRFALVITDLRMPGLDGIALLGRLRAMGGEPPAIVVTAAPDGDTQARVLAAGAVACLSKPFDHNALLGLIGRLLDRGGEPRRDA